MPAESIAVNPHPPHGVNDASRKSLDNKRVPIRDASNDVYCDRCDVTTVPHDRIIESYEDALALGRELGPIRVSSPESLRKAKLRDVGGYFPVPYDVNASAVTNDPCKWVAYWTWKLGGPDPRPRYRRIGLAERVNALRRVAVSDDELARLEAEVKKLEAHLAKQRTLTTEIERLAHADAQFWSDGKEIGDRTKCGQETARDYKRAAELLAASKRTTKYLAGIVAALDPDVAQRAPSPKQRLSKLATALFDSFNHYRCDRETIAKILNAHGIFAEVP